MQGQQLELWELKGAAQLLAIPPPYQELTPDQRRRIIEQLARLILKAVQIDTNTNSQTSTSSEPTDQRQP